jgi:hypothetical protein
MVENAGLESFRSRARKPWFAALWDVFQSHRGEASRPEIWLEINGMSAGSDLVSSGCGLVHGCSPDIRHLPRLTMAGEFCHGPPAYGC